MILLLPGFTLFLLLAAPGGWRSMFAPRSRRARGRPARRSERCSTPGTCARCGYCRTPPRRARRRAAAILVRRHQVRLARHDGAERAALDARATTSRCTASISRSSSAWAGPLLAAIGLEQLALRTGAAAVLMLAAVRGERLFAFSYNVGDTHVFYLPSHLILALLMAPALVLRRSSRQTAARHWPLPRSLLYAGAPRLSRLPGSRPQRRSPADRVLSRADRRPRRSATRSCSTDLNWQIENGLSYFASVLHAGSRVHAHAGRSAVCSGTVRITAPIGRRRRADGAMRATTLASAYGPLLSIAPDPTAIDRARLAMSTRGLHAGTRYVLCVLKPVARLAARRRGSVATRSTG